MTVQSDLVGQHIALRLVELSDAAFIVKLRTSVSARGGLHSGASSEAEQRKWLLAYFERHLRQLEHYFIILHHGSPAGAVRLYNVDGEKGSFTWGSWVVLPGTDPAVSWLSAIAVYDFAFDTLGLTVAHFEVLAQNANVVRFHRGFGATLVRQTEAVVAFSLTRHQYRTARVKLLRRIGGITGCESSVP